MNAASPSRGSSVRVGGGVPGGCSGPRAVTDCFALAGKLISYSGGGLLERPRVQRSPAKESTFSHR